MLENITQPSRLSVLKPQIAYDQPASFQAHSYAQTILKTLSCIIDCFFQYPMHLSSILSRKIQNSSIIHFCILAYFTLLKHLDPKHPIPKHPIHKYPTYHQASLLQASYPQASYPQASYLHASYPQASYPKASYSQASYPQPNYPRAFYLKHPIFKHLIHKHLIHKHLVHKHLVHKHPTFGPKAQGIILFKKRFEISFEHYTLEGIEKWPFLW